MRGYGSVVAGFVILALILVSSLSLFYTYYRSGDLVAGAQQFKENVLERKEEINCSLVSHFWNGTVFSFTLRNTGTSAVKLNEISVFLDGKRYGFTVSEETEDNFFSPGESFIFRIPISHRPHRLTVVLGPFVFKASVHGWLDSCLFRRRIQIDKNNTLAVVEFEATLEDGNTIRVTKGDGETEINYFVEHVSGNVVRVWTYSEENEFYVYYSGCSTQDRNTENVFIRVVPGVLAYYPLDGNGIDLVYGNNLTEHNVSYQSGARRTGAYLQGTVYSYLETPFDRMEENITVLFWMKTSDLNNNGTPLSYSSSTSPDEFVVYNYGNFRVYRESNWKQTGVSANDGVWHHISVSWDTGGNVVMYKDGALAYAGTGLHPGDPLESNGLLVLGEEQDLTGFDQYQAFKGLLDEVLIFGRVLEFEEIDALYKNDAYVSPYIKGKVYVVNYPLPVATVGEEEYK